MNKPLKSRHYAKSARLAKHYANEHTVFSSKDWQALWALIFEAYKAGYRNAAKEKS